MKRLALIVVLILTVGTVFSPSRQTRAASASVLLYIPGSLGDLGFLDSANAGVMRAKSQLGIQVKVVQQSNSAQWQNQLVSLAGTKRYDLLIFPAGASESMINATKAIIAKYPQQHIIDFDENSFATAPQVSSIIYRQNEGSFLGGALAAMVADSNLPYVSHKKIIGMIAGTKYNVMLDFFDGYQQGAKAVDPAMDVRITYIGGSGGNDTWNNKPAGARLAASFYNAGAAVVYNVAGGSGLGIFSQAKALNRYALGVDSNQDMLAPGHVIGSVVKRVDNSLFDLINLYHQGKLQGAHTYYYGLANQGVDLTRDAETRAIITPAMYQKLDALRAQVMSGKIKVKSEFK